MDLEIIIYAIEEYILIYNLFNNKLNKCNTIWLFQSITLIN